MKNMIFDDNGVYINNLANNGDHYGIGQYAFPQNFELAGKTVKLGGHQIVFNCGKGLEYDGQKFAYKCQKLEKDLYFVNFSLCGLVVDTKTGVATLITGDELVSGPMDGSEGAGHACSGDEMIGTEVAWVLGCGRFTTQKYTEPGKCVVGWSPREAAEQEMECCSLKVRDSFYLVDIKGEVLRACCVPFFTNRVIMLQDYERMMCVGVALGKGIDPVSFAGYAQII